MSGKRPHGNDDEHDAKRVRSNQGSPIPAHTSGLSDLERKKQEAAARIAALKARSTTAVPPPNHAPSQQEAMRSASTNGVNNGGTDSAVAKLAAAKERIARIQAGKANGNTAPAQPSGPAEKAINDAKIAAAKERIAKIQAGKLSTSNGTVAVSPSPPPTPSSSDGLSIEAKRAAAQKKIDEIRARAAANKSATSSMSGTIRVPREGDNPTKLMEARARASGLAAQRREGHRRQLDQRPLPMSSHDAPGGQRGGPSAALHPLLLGNQVQPGKDSTGQGVSKLQRDASKPAVNPYLSTDQDASTDAKSLRDPELRVRRAGVRKTRDFVFNEKGKYMKQANRLREQAELEEMKRKVAAESRKTAIEEAGDKVFLVTEPPAVEWWDEGLLPPDQNSYERWGEPGRNKIDTPDSIITSLIQHPAMLTAPQDKHVLAAKPVMLTREERRKARRQRRMADMKEEQVKVRLGLLPTPTPKVKKGNMMRVFGEQAVKDPTAVEARVNREIAERADKHLQANADRQLKPGERHEKLKQQQVADEAKGVKVAVFRVDDLGSGKHRYLVDINAKQTALTGIVVMNPTMYLIVIEGGAHSVTAFKKLMLNRIKWTENTPPREDTKATTFTGTTDGSNADASAGTKGVGSKAMEWCKPFDDDGNLKDFSGNRCVLVWEGEEPARMFKKWGSKACETDGEAREVLRKQKMENMWTLARGK